MQYGYINNDIDGLRGTAGTILLNNTTFTVASETTTVPVYTDRMIIIINRHLTNFYKIVFYRNSQMNTSNQTVEAGEEYVVISGAYMTFNMVLHLCGSTDSNDLGDIILIEPGTDSTISTCYLNKDSYDLYLYE